MPLGYSSRPADVCKATCGQKATPKGFCPKWGSSLLCFSAGVIVAGRRCAVSAARTKQVHVMRGFVAGLAAYALALQLLLPSFALAQVISNASLHAVLCASDSVADEYGPAPVDHHHQVCPCGPLCPVHQFGASTGPMLISASHPIAWVTAATAYGYPRHLARNRPQGDLGSTPHNPRAPPTADV